MPSRPRYVVPLPGGRRLELGTRTLVMGVLNLTPDSFSADGLHDEPERAIDTALAMIEAGADIIDVGGESSRPGAVPVSAWEELGRVLPVVDGLAGAPVPISIDTTKGTVADEALSAGATIVNDVSGLEADGTLAEVVARHGAGIVLMHMRGTPATMTDLTGYADLVADVARELQARVDHAVSAGISRDAIVLDPGLGFAKRAEQSLALLAALDAPPLRALDRPWLVGASRKSFLKLAIGPQPPSARDWATAGAVTAAILCGAHIVRVHRVREMVDVVRVADAVRARRDAGD